MLAAGGFGLLGWLDYSGRHTVESYFREMYYERPSETNYARPAPDKSAYAKAIEQQTSRKGIQILLTGTFMAAAFFIIVSKKIRSNDKRWAFAIAGMIVGYWLRG